MALPKSVESLTKLLILSPSSPQLLTTNVIKEKIAEEVLGLATVLAVHHKVPLLWAALHSEGRH
jgi:hypothetical protein